SPHMSLIVKIAGTFYPLYPGGTLTVPSGVSKATPIIQSNDANIDINTGAYNLCVDVTNNQSASWTYFADFTLSTNGWIASAGPEALYSPGTGWIPNPAFAGWTAQCQTTLHHNSNIGQVQFTYKFTGTTGEGIVGVGATSYGNIIYETGLNPSSGNQLAFVSTPVPVIAGDLFYLHVSSGISSDMADEVCVQILVTG